MPLIFVVPVSGPPMTINVEEGDRIKVEGLEGMTDAELHRAIRDMPTALMIRHLEARGKVVVGKKGLKPEQVAPELIKHWWKPITKPEKLKTVPRPRKKPSSTVVDVESDGSDIVRIRGKPESKAKAQAKGKASSSSTTSITCHWLDLASAIIKAKR